MEKTNDILKPYLRLYHELDEEARKQLLWCCPYDNLVEEYGNIYLGSDKNSENYLKATSVKNAVFDILKEDSKKLKIFIPLLWFIGVKQDFFQAGSKDIEDEMGTLSIEVLDKLNVQISIPINLPEYDVLVKNTRMYRKVKDSYSFTEIYDYIDACESGALEKICFKMNILKLYIQFLYDKDQEKLVQIIEKKQDIFLLHIINYWIPKEQMLNIASKCSNFHYIFDVLRCCFYMKTIVPNEITEQELTQYKQLMIKMSSNKEVWRKMVCYFVSFPSRATGIYYLFGYIVECLAEENVMDIIQYMKIEKKNLFGRGQEGELFFLSHIQTPVSKRWRMILEKIFEKWLNYIENSGVAYEVIQTNIDLAVKFYVNNIMSDERKEELLAEYRIRLDENDNVWFESKREHQTSCFRLLTIVRCLSEV